MSRTRRMKFIIRWDTSWFGNMGLTPSTLDSLQTASKAGVMDAMSRIATNFSDDHWFAQHHLYRASPTESRYGRLRRDIGNGNVNDNALAEYVGVSAPTHTFDGWSLLSRSVSCLLRGDPYSAVHLAYYAELRATIAILASEGIGIFNRKHCIVDRNGNCELINVKGRPRNRVLGTHECAWSVFEWWANGRQIHRSASKGHQTGSARFGHLDRRNHEIRFFFSGYWRRLVENLGARRGTILWRQRLEK